MNRVYELNRVKKWLYLSVFLLFVLSSSCGVLKRSKTNTQTITITKVDTIIIFTKDTVLITKSVPIMDTVFIENKTSVARSYFNPVKNKIVLELKGKPFEVPVSLQKTMIENKKQVETKRISTFWWYFTVITLLITLIFLILIIKKIK